MKKETNTTTKGELLQDKFTNGEWVVEQNSSFNQIGERVIIRAQVTKDNLWERIVEFEPGKNCMVTGLLGGSAKANAELICQAVNERQKLLDSNRELLDCLYSIRMDLHPASESRKRVDNLLINAKNIHP